MAVNAGILAYDIADDKRRARVHRLLSSYGLAVQESIFALELSPARWTTLRQKLQRLVHAQQDDVRVWLLCGHCRQREQLWCGQQRIWPGALAIV